MIDAAPKAPDFLGWSSPPLRHTPRRRPHGSMNFQSFEAVNGAQLRAIDSLEASEKRRLP
jgi:hypothetical protein